MVHLRPNWISSDSDGCTFWPDGDYLPCCQAHDKAYAAGGSWLDRLRADWKLAKCVKRAKHLVVAPVMFVGVRVIGSVFWPWHMKWSKGE